VKDKIIRKFKVEKKDKAVKEAKDAKKEPEKVELTAKEGVNSPLVEGHKMPTEKEILERAQQLYMKANGKFQDLLGTNLPEKSELKEEGFLKAAQLELMTKGDIKNERAILDYVGGLKNELEQIGFTVVPIEGFTL
jgi:hypothetical protein